MEDRKYEMLMDDWKNIDGRRVYRIQALKDVNIEKGIIAGTLGGYIESEKNLSQKGDCWIGGDASVISDALVEGSAYVRENALVADSAVVKGQAKVEGFAMVFNKAQVDENAVVGGKAIIADTACVKGNTVVDGYAVVMGKAEVIGNSVIKDKAVVKDRGFVNGAVIEDDAVVAGHSAATEFETVSGNTMRGVYYQGMEKLNEDFDAVHKKQARRDARLKRVEHSKGTLKR